MWGGVVGWGGVCPTDDAGPLSLTLEQIFLPQPGREEQVKQGEAAWGLGSSFHQAHPELPSPHRGEAQGSKISCLRS